MEGPFFFPGARIVHHASGAAAGDPKPVTIAAVTANPALKMSG